MFSTHEVRQGTVEEGHYKWNNCIVHWQLHLCFMHHQELGIVINIMRGWSMFFNAIIRRTMNHQSVLLCKV